MNDEFNIGRYNCEWMKNPGKLNYGSNLCPIHPVYLEDGTLDPNNHGWYKYTPEEHDELCTLLARNRLLDEMQRKKEKTNETM